MIDCQFAGLVCRSSLVLKRFQLRGGAGVGAAALLGLCQSAWAANLAPLGSGIMGVNDAVDADAGVLYFHAGVAGAINDGDAGTHVDNYFGDPPTDGGKGVSYVGIVWPDVRYESIQTLTLDLALFGDGGWFGINGQGPGAGGALTEDQVLAPSVQVSTNSGVSWQTVPASSDYSAVMIGTTIGGGDNPNPVNATVKFTLNSPATKISGIRIIGQNGGQADGNGFIGVAELQVDAAAATDTDGDGLPDEWETAHGLNVGTNDANADSDGDGLSNVAEFTAGTNPKAIDTDGDGFQDGLEISLGSSPTDGTKVPNLARSGTGFIGVKESLESGPETEQDYAHAGDVTAINDGNPASRVDTYNGDTPTQVGYVGIRWDSALTNKLKSLKLNMATFLDGGWFGPNGTGPGAGGALRTNHLTEPKVEITTDGSTWVPVAFTSDYVQKLTGHKIGGGAVPNPSSVVATFTLNQETNGITGIRVIGTEGGQASGGFLGVFELEAFMNGSDVDNDGLDDVWERQNGLNVGVNDAASDADKDGLTNLQEFDGGTNPQIADTDGDGLNDGAELNTNHTDPRQSDTDGDGLSDGAEVNTHHTNPSVVDTDGDGFADGIEITLGSSPTDANSVPSNIAASGTPILGVQESVDTGEPVPVFNAGAPGAINDSDPLTRVDTFSGGSETASFVGILWDKPVTTPITKLELTLATFFDGGWFGVNGVGPGNGGVLSPTEHLVEPVVQVSTNKGVTWQAVPFASDYIQALTDHPLPAEAFGPPTSAKATFTLTTPQSNITGIRIIGSEGGTASSGFLGVFELGVLTAGSSSGGDGVKLINTAVQTGTFEFQFATAQGTSYQVQFKNNLSDATWQSLTTVTGDGTTKSVSDNRTTPARFYRVVTQ